MEYNIYFVLLCTVMCLSNRFKRGLDRIDQCETTWSCGVKHLSTRPRRARLNHDMFDTMPEWQSEYCSVAHVLVTLAVLTAESWRRRVWQHATLFDPIIWDRSGCHRIASRQRQGARSWPCNRVLPMLSCRLTQIETNGIFCFVLSWA
jgi:hypothetical protein